MAPLDRSSSRVLEGTRKSRICPAYAKISTPIRRSYAKFSTATKTRVGIPGVELSVMQALTLHGYFLAPSMKLSVQANKHKNIGGVSFWSYWAFLTDELIRPCRSVILDSKRAAPWSCLHLLLGLRKQNKCLWRERSCIPFENVCMADARSQIEKGIEKEVQITDFDNAAFSIFVVLLGQYYISISTSIYQYGSSTKIWRLHMLGMR